MRVLVVGAGAVGARTVRQLHATEDVSEVVVVDRVARRAAQLCEELGANVVIGSLDPETLRAVSATVIATGRAHREVAERALEFGCPVVSTTDVIDDALALLDLGTEAAIREIPLLVGVAFAPGLSCLIARQAATRFDSVDEIHVAKFGTGGPECARHHHAALASESSDWRDGVWAHRPGGSGRELAWFPDPIGGRDCYRAAVCDSYLLQPAFRNASRITARVSATRRDRLTSRLPMMRQPHPEGLEGAIRVEVRGTIDGQRSDVIWGVVDRPAVAAGTVAAITALAIGRKEIDFVGSAGLATAIKEPAEILRELAQRGIEMQMFEGADDF